MTWNAVPVLVVGGITLYVGLYHLWLQLRRPNTADFSFAFTCFGMGLYDFCSAALYDASSLEVGEVWQRWQAVTLLLVAIPFLSFVAAFSRTPARRLRWVQAFYGLGALWVWLDPWQQAYAAASVKHLQTRFGPIAYYERDLGPLLMFFVATLVPMIGYVVWSGYRGLVAAQERVSDHESLSSAERATIERARQRMLPLTVGACLLLFGLVHDSLAAFHVFTNIYLTEYSWFGVIALMSWTLSEEVVDAAVTRQVLRETQVRIATTLDSIQDAVITTDIAGRIAHLNPAAERMLNVSNARAQGRALAKLLEITSAETLTQVPDPIRYAVGRPPNPYGRLPQLVTTDGAERKVDLGGAPLIDAEGRVQGAVVVIRDLTVQQSAIESLQHAKQVESMGQLAGGIAHDLNNLLTPILSYVELVQRQVQPDSRSALFLGHVQEAAHKAAGLTRQLLALSRKQVLDVHVLALAELVRETSPLLRRMVGDEYQLELELDPRCGNVQVDPGQFEQVLLNLVSNARDAMPGGGTIRIVARRLHEREVMLAVADEGTGIERRVLERIFEPFFTTKPRGKGTGLGLAQVRGIVEQHGGTIHVDSEVGVGTTFEIVLPAVDGDEVRSSSRSLPMDEAARGDETVLVVEDDAAVRALVHDALTQLGYHVRTADGLTTAVAIAASEPLDLLITDVVMPGADGPRVYRAVLEHHRIPCLYITGHADDRLGDRGFLPKGTEVLRKPFTVGQLAAQVRLVLGRWERGESQSDQGDPAGQAGVRGDPAGPDDEPEAGESSSDVGPRPLRG
ncbi:MAG TPA: ATP-binding protein [Polyangiaceae bacterium]|nr:ATP-binding protein [Polyangiaceae bacterium]